MEMKHWAQSVNMGHFTTSQMILTYKPRDSTSGFTSTDKVSLWRLCDILC